MRVYKELSTAFDLLYSCWSGGLDTVKDLTYEQAETVMAILEDLYPDGVDMTTVNDILWFERDTIAEWLGFSDYDELLKEKRR